MQTSFRSKVKVSTGVEVVSDYRSDAMWIFRLSIQEKEFHVTCSAVEKDAVEITFSVLQSSSTSFHMMSSLFKFVYIVIVDLFKTLSLFKDKNSETYKIVIFDTHSRRSSLYHRLFKKYQLKGQKEVDNKFHLSNVDITNNMLEIFIQRA